MALRRRDKVAFAGKPIWHEARPSWRWPHEPERRSVEVSHVVLGARELACDLRVHDVAVVTALAADRPLISADPHHLQQVVLDLVTNTKHAMRQAPRAFATAQRHQPERANAVTEPS